MIREATMSIMAMIKKKNIKMKIGQKLEVILNENDNFKPRKDLKNCQCHD